MAGGVLLRCSPVLAAFQSSAAHILLGSGTQTLPVIA